MVFPGLEAGETLGRETRLGERAALLAADGSSLAEGPASARTSPLGASGIAIAGAMGSPSRKQDTSQYALGFPKGTLIGTSGLELAFNERLAGQPSGELFATGEEGQKRTLATGEPTDGEAVKTTIDPDVQTAAVTALADRYGGVAVLDAKTGDVRGVAGLAFSAPQPPGSTFKIITATAALDAGVVELDDEFPVEASNSDIGREITNAGDAPCGGTFVESFANSCNTVFAPLGVETGQEKMVETAEAFGFNSPPALAAPDELEALAPPTPSLGEIESDVALGESSIGQGQVLATPLLMASVAQTIANDGVRLPDLDREDAGAPARRGAGRGHFARDRPEGRGHDARGRALGNGHGRADPRNRGRGQVGHGRARARWRSSRARSSSPARTLRRTRTPGLRPTRPPTSPSYAIAVMLVSTPGGGGTVAAPIARDDLRLSILED